MSKVQAERSKDFTPHKSRRPLSQEISQRYQGKVYKKPRQWQYIKEPIVDVFKKAEEVQVFIYLGNFRKG